jgi:hypothetical protein
MFSAFDGVVVVGFMPRTGTSVGLAERQSPLGLGRWATLTGPWLAEPLRLPSEPVIRTSELGDQRASPRLLLILSATASAAFRWRSLVTLW